MEAVLHLVTSTPSPSPFSLADRDQISSQLVRMILHVLEQPPAAKDKNIRAVLARCLGAALMLDEKQNLPAITAIFHALIRYEHLPGPLADILVRMTQEHQSLCPFVVEFVAEIARVPSDTLSKDPGTAKALATFMLDLSERMPAVFQTNLALVLSLLHAESYTVRNGVVHIIGALIRHAPNPDDPLLDVLMSRAQRDVNAFTRSKAFQTWISLAEARVIPNRIFSSLADLAVSRLDDKAAAVRKTAAQLLTSLMRTNPFGPALRKSHFQKKLDESRAAVPDAVVSDAVDTEPADGKEHMEGGKENVSPTLNVPEGTSKKGTSSSTSEEGEEETIVEDSPQTVEETGITLKKRYYMSAVSFIQSVEMGLQQVYNMLRSKSITDVTQAVSFLITAVQFQLEATASEAVRKILPLILARESNIRNTAVQAYVRLLAPNGLDSLDEKEAAMAVAKGLIALGVGSTTGELACLEALISSICKSEDYSNLISTAVVSVIWDLFSGQVPGASKEQRQAACMIIGMMASDRPESLHQRVHIIEKVGLPEPYFARWSCVALCKLPPICNEDGRLTTQLSDLILKSLDLSTVEQAITAIFSLASEPEAAMGNIIRTLEENIHSNCSEVEVRELSRFLFIIGHVAVKQLVRSELLVTQVRKSITTQAHDDEHNEEEEQACAEADRALELAEKELVSPKSLLGRYAGLARKIAVDNAAPSELQASAVLCLSKLMCVQGEFCNNNLRLLFSILNSAEDALVRGNAVTALGDLAFRFPNIVEPWSSHIYSALQDKDDMVRKNTLMALTHLILNDMIKVKGQIVGLAVCILDENTRIADLARLFFHELARKSTNAVYNILPDTISCMSKMEELKSEDFKTVVAFLVSLMDKEKHADGMVDKLCHRFRTSESDRENQDLAYCISQLNISERGLKKLNDNFKSYSACIVDDLVHSCIMQAVGKGNKAGSSASCIQVVEELTGKINLVRKCAVEELEASQICTASESQEKENVHSQGEDSSRNARERRSRSVNRKKRIVVSNDDEDCSDDAEETDAALIPSPTGERRSRSSRSTKKVMVEEDSETEVFDDEISDEEARPCASRKTMKKISKGNDSDGDDSIGSEEEESGGEASSEECRSDE